MQDVHPIGSALCHRRLRPHSHHQTAAALKCPRCDSLNTKFCYYNNYNLSQPRHFCKNCRRYWTNGGVLRNVPVGGSSRKSKPKPKPKPKPEPDPKPNSVVFEQNAGFTTLASNSGSDPGPELLGLAGAEAAPEMASLEFLQRELAGGVLDPTVRIEDLLRSTGSEGRGVALHWQAADHDQNVLGLFDLPPPHEDQAFWTQATTSFHHWAENSNNNTRFN